MAATWLTSGRKSRPQVRVTRIPAASPRLTASSAAAATIARWLSNNRAKLARG
ncbi:hypothetical protein D3C84_1058210 [compost metagenome]